MTEERKQIIDHISRLEGQLASIKKELSQNKVDCAKASSTLLSASRSFAGLREKFVSVFLLKHFVGNIKKGDVQLYDKLTSLIKG